MTISHARRLVVAILVAAVIASVAPIGVAGASSRDTTDAGHLSPSGRVFELYAAIFNGRDTNAANVLIAEDAVLTTPYGEYVGPEGVLNYVALVKRSYPDAEFHITGIESRGETVEVEWTMTASRFQTDPVEQPIDVDVTITGNLTLTVTDTEITGMNQANTSIAITNPIEVTVSSRSDR
jgi:hypothetical protein